MSTSLNQSVSARLGSPHALKFTMKDLEGDKRRGSWKKGLPMERRQRRAVPPGRILLPARSRPGDGENAMFQPRLETKRLAHTMLGWWWRGSDTVTRSTLSCMAVFKMVVRRALLMVETLSEAQWRVRVFEGRGGSLLSLKLVSC